LIALQAKQDLALKGQPNGYPDLDATGKVPTSQLPGGGGGGGTLYKGSWNALTNTPSITTGSANAGNIGWFYIVSVAGTTNVDGIASWAVSDQIVSNGTIWQKIVASGSGVTSVNSRTGVVTLTKADVGLTNVDNTSDVSKNSAVGTLTNKTIDGAANTLNVRLNTSDVSGNLPVSRLNAGTGAGPNTWWCGDNTWKQPNGTGDVTGVGSSVVGESVVMSDTNGKRVAGYSGPQGFAIITPGNATTAIPYIDVGHLDPQLIHGLPEKVAVVDLDEILIWDSSTGTFMKVKKQNLGVPPGSIIDFGGTTAPNGYLLCDGKSYLRTDYAGLFSAIGVQWGSVDSTHFTVPDFRGFVAAGKDDMGGTNANRLSTLGAAATTIGGAGGAQTHTLTLAQLAQHRHLGADHTHSNNSWNAYQTMADGGGHRCVYWDTYQNINTGAADRALYTDYQGSNGAHNNIQPTRMVLKIIKY
jgi:microcystin-dependent protein